MLHINRKPGEAILLDKGKIKVIVTRIHGQIASLSIDAPPEIDILREELLNQDNTSDGSDYC